MTEITTDKRIEGVRDEMREGFARSDRRIDDLRTEMHRGFDGVDRRFERVETDIRELRADTKTGFDSMNARFDSMLKLMIGFFATTVGSVIAAVLAKILFHF